MDDNDPMEALISQIHGRLGPGYSLVLSYKLKPLHDTSTTLKQEGFEGGEVLDLVATHGSKRNTTIRASMSVPDDSCL